MRNRAWLILSLLLSPWACAAETYGMRYEVSLDGLTWSSNVNVPPESVVKFRVSAYFEPGVTVTTTDGPGTAVAVSRVTGSQQGVGVGGGGVGRRGGVGDGRSRGAHLPLPLGERPRDLRRELPCDRAFVRGAEAQGVRGSSRARSAATSAAVSASVAAPPYT